MKTRWLVLRLALFVAILTLSLGTWGVPVARAASIIVNNLADSTGGATCTLRDAITSANTDTATGGCAAGLGADTITFSVTGTILLGSTLPAINGALTIDGTGQDIAISGQNLYQVFIVPAGATLNLMYLEIANGYIASASGAPGGGGAYVIGTLTVTGCTFANNHTTSYGGAIEVDGGNATVTASTFTGNTADLSGGGAIDLYNGNTLLVTNSTFTGNSGGSDGAGGIYIFTGTGTVNFSTLAGNTSGPTVTYGAAGGVFAYTGSTVTLSNSILASNTVQNCNVYGTGVVADGGYNLVWGDTTCPFTVNADPKLLALSANGGPTETMALDNATPAAEQIPSGTNGCGTAITTDQRGEVRPGTRNQPTNRCEIGAWEAQIVDPTAITLRTLGASSRSSLSLVLGGLALAVGGFALIGFVKRRR